MGTLCRGVPERIRSLRAGLSSHKALHPSAAPSLVAGNHEGTVGVTTKISTTTFIYGGTYLALGVGAPVVNLVSLAIYRLYLSPIAKFPGPKLAALSSWHEFYYDLHIDDPDYYDVLYARGTGGRNKYAYFSGRFGYAHRQRRKAISPFFSVAKVADFQTGIRAKVDKLCQKLDGYVANESAVVRLNRAWMALTTDIITECTFASSYGQLDSPDFADTLHEALVAVYVTDHFALHFPVVFPILDLLPEWLVRWGQPAIMPVVGLCKDLAARVRQIRDGINAGHKAKSHATIFHALLHDDRELPDAENSDARLGDEAQLIIAAGLITTSRHAARLRAELAASAEQRPHDWRQLEKLPFLRGVVHEAMRLAHGIATRDPRLAPDAELVYRS
ncbi:hypothetical protein VTK56DRAFT_10152 [Thermocarpiscus australiensis]